MFFMSFAIFVVSSHTHNMMMIIMMTLIISIAEILYVLDKMNIEILLDRSRKCLKCHFYFSFTNKECEEHPD